MSSNHNDAPTNALAIRQESPLAMPSLTMDEAQARYEMMVMFVSKQMKRDKDFGVIPGTDKPTLLKPGAEKLCTFFGLRPIPVLLDKMEDWDKGFFYYLYRYELYKGDTLIAAADGSANSKEKKYRWRNVPEFKATEDEKQRAVKREKRPTKKGGTFYMLTIENDDPYTLVNTLQKMAQKRALIAAALIGVNASEFFTQDIEDMADAIEGEWTEEEPKASGHKADTSSNPPEQQPHADAAPGLAWVRDLNAVAGLYENAAKKGLSKQQVLAALEVDDITKYVSSKGQAWAVVLKAADTDKPETRPEPHWTTVPERVAAIEQWATKQGLGTAYIPDALGVDELSAYTGTMDEAKKAIRQFAEGVMPEGEPEAQAAG